MRRFAALLALVLAVLVAPPARAAEPPSLDALAEVGAVEAVVRVSDGAQSWTSSLGGASPEARFRAGSVTKTVVAVLALQLVQKGRWSMSTTIGDVLPRLWPGRGDVTLRQLLSHTSGMPDFLPTYVAQAPTPKEFLKVIAQRRTDRELVAAAKEQDWLFRPGSSYSYSNTGFVVVGMMLRKATGKPVAELAERRVFRPAGMTSSRLASNPKVRQPELVETAFLAKKQRDVSSTSPTLFSSAGSLVTTSLDLDRFQAALSAGELVGQRQVRAMRSLVAAKEGYGLGSYRLPDPCAEGKFVFGHDGGTWGTLTMSFARPGGGTRVTVAMTGRDLDDVKGTQVVALVDYVTEAFAQTC